MKDVIAMMVCCVLSSSGLVEGFHPTDPQLIPAGDTHLQHVGGSLTLICRFVSIRPLFCLMMDCILSNVEMSSLILRIC